MKTIKHLFLLILVALLANACSNNDDEISLEGVASRQVQNLHAPQQGGQGEPVSGNFTKFDFSSGQVTTSDTDWDIAFRGTTIIVNGGISVGTNDEPMRNGNAAAYIANGTLSSITEVNNSLFIQDSNNGYAIPSGSGNGWYLYNAQAFLIVPIAGKVLVFRTRDNRYAKVEILSYYKNAPANPDVMVDKGRYYTFNYVYQPNLDVNSF
ncbi:HmuY family protein [Ascidiimonas sp. W6]|uniref:HmuY family protein n=1 Tax=Ascidiimonas meishanensis TaxID=3128903 RepID=UPI0030EE182A